MSDLNLPQKLPIKMRHSWNTYSTILARAGVNSSSSWIPLNDAMGPGAGWAPWPYSRYKDLYDLVQVIGAKWTLRFDALRCTTKIPDNTPPQLIWARVSDDNANPFPAGSTRSQLATTFSGIRGSRDYKLRWIGCTTNSTDKIKSAVTIKGYSKMRRYYNANDAPAYSQKTDGRPANYIYLSFGLVDPYGSTRTDDIGMSIHVTYYCIFKNPKDVTYSVFAVPGGRTQVTFPTLGDTETAEPTIP